MRSWREGAVAEEISPSSGVEMGSGNVTGAQWRDRRPAEPSEMTPSPSVSRSATLALFPSARWPSWLREAGARTGGAATGGAEAASKESLGWGSSSGSAFCVGAVRAERIEEVSSSSNEWPDSSFDSAEPSREEPSGSAFRRRFGNAAGEFELVITISLPCSTRSHEAVRSNSET